ncbi:hypothetical protein AMJ47_03525 [Parcubacteria bacterium DG_72]|nr:MAG: hypothetical protein AMJ47_03525 [Parcubacteria bacterium DG_72]
MKKEEILKLINQQIELTLEKFRQEIKKERKTEKPSESKDDDTISLQTFIDEKNPRKVSSEEMPVLAYYLREIDRRKLTEVDEKIMKLAYQKTDRSRPKRIKQAFIDNPYFDKISKKPGFYKLNEDGDYFVEIMLKERKRNEK